MLFVLFGIVFLFVGIIIGGSLDNDANANPNLTSDSIAQAGLIAGDEFIVTQPSSLDFSKEGVVNYRRVIMEDLNYMFDNGYVFQQMVILRQVDVGKNTPEYGAYVTDAMLVYKKK